MKMIKKPEKMQNNKYVVGAGMLLLAASANAGPLDEIGTKVAEAISAFIGVVTAIGMAAITVIVAIQGFKLAWGMIKTIK
ncbi:MAG: major capsid protein [Alysiella sp.]|nr:major capsid protein [Alysiella sp.]MDO4433725.1 major capsid protein [Alysiella sp.]